MYQRICLGNICITAYGLMLMVAVFLCACIILLKTKRMGIAFEEMMIVMAVALGAALISAGTLYIFVSYSVKEFIESVVKGDFNFLYNVGLVFYGGLVGGIIGAVIAVRWQGLDTGTVERCVVPVIPLGHAIGRIGCLLAGCCYGLEYTGPLAVKNTLISPEKTYFPIQAVEAFFNLGIFVYLLWYARKKRNNYHILCVYLLVYAVLRFILEFYRGDLIRGSFSALSTSQWISILLFVVSILGLYLTGEKKKTKALQK